MLALARFIMASRVRAGLVASVGNLLPLVSPATVALVALRKGWRDGLLVALWAVLPVAALFYAGGMAPALASASLLTVAVAMAAALVLRGTASWQFALLTLVASSAALALLMERLQSAEVAAFGAGLGQLFAQMQAAGRGPLWEPDTVAVLGLLAWVMAAGALGSLLLGRWWQALLYNPGGLGRELRGLRLSAPLALGLMAGLVACQLGPLGYVTWGNLLGLPLFLNGVALVHHLVAASPRIGTHWLAVFYVGLVLLLGPLGILLTGVGFVDSLVDLRARLARRSSSNGRGGPHGDG